MIRAKRSDTLVGTIERQYGIDLKARADMKLETLLQERGFESQTQLLKAHRGQLDYPAKKRRLFLSFHAEDRDQVAGFRLMPWNPNLQLDFYDGSLEKPVESDSEAYVRSVIREKIRRCSVLICLIGNGTAWRDWVEWEIQTAKGLGKGLCGVRLKDSVGQAPPLLREFGAPVARWDMTEIVRAIECAAARR
jgi:hypothetical protein